MSGATDLTTSEWAVLLILADDEPHDTWGRATDPNMQRRGRKRGRCHQRQRQAKQSAERTLGAMLFYRARDQRKTAEFDPEPQP